MKLKAYIKYLFYILEHKWFVFLASFKYKCVFRGIMHDMSKFSKEEFFAYAHYFYIDKEKYKEEFEKAWEHHYRYNKHHWKYFESPIMKRTRPMEEMDIREMVADWCAMSKKFGGSEQEYYLANYNKLNLDRSTRIRLEALLGLSESWYRTRSYTIKEILDMNGKFIDCIKDVDYIKQYLK